MGPKRQGKDVTVSLEVVICTAIDWVDSLAFGDRVGNLEGLRTEAQFSPLIFQFPSPFWQNQTFQASV